MFKYNDPDNEDRTWHFANDRCEAYGGYLACINDETEDDEVNYIRKVSILFCTKDNFKKGPESHNSFSVDISAKLKRSLLTSRIVYFKPGLSSVSRNQ